MRAEVLSRTGISVKNSAPLMGVYKVRDLYSGGSMAYLVKRKCKRIPGWVYYVRHTRLGKDERIATGTSDAKLAEVIRKKIEEEDKLLAQGLPIPDRIKHIRLRDFIVEYLASREGNCAPRTIQTDRAKLEIFIKFMDDERRFVSSITSKDVERFREIRLKQVSPATVNISLGHLRSAFQWAEHHGYCTKNPFAIKRLKIRIDHKIPRALSPDEVEQFLAVVEEEHLPIFKFLLATGCRRSELSNLTWDDIDFQGKIITFRHTKGKRDRTVPLTLEMSHLLSQIRQDQGKVFKYGPYWYTHLFRKYKRIAGLPEHYTLHSLRHTCASLLLRKGVSIYVVQKLLGHSSISVTERYLHALPTDLREAAEILSQEAQVV
jgi:integrase